RPWIALASVLVLASVFVRAELLVLPIAAAAVVASEVLSSRSQAWTFPIQRPRLVALGGAAAVTFASLALLLRQGSRSLRVAESHPLRIVEYAAWALGALTIGLGIVPLIASIAAFSHPASRQERQIAALFTATAVGLLVYTGVKAAYLSTIEGALIEERNLI